MLRAYREDRAYRVLPEQLAVLVRREHKAIREYRAYRV